MNMQVDLDKIVRDPNSRLVDDADTQAGSREYSEFERRQLADFSKRSRYWLDEAFRDNREATQWAQRRGLELGRILKDCKAISLGYWKPHLDLPECGPARVDSEALLIFYLGPDGLPDWSSSVLSPIGAESTSVLRASRCRCSRRSCGRMMMGRLSWLRALLTP